MKYSALISCLSLGAIGTDDSVERGDLLFTFTDLTFLDLLLKFELLFKMVMLGVVVPDEELRLRNKRANLFEPKVLLPAEDLAFLYFNFEFGVKGI